MEKQNYDKEKFWSDIESAHRYNELINNHPKKTKLLSSISSNKEFLLGHKLRIKFVTQYLKNIPNYDLYGAKSFANLGYTFYKGKLSKTEKHKALDPYKYTFANENCFENNYFTEKLTDAILCECLCFYDGCPNIENFIDPNAFIRIDLKNPEKAIQLIKMSIANNEWEKRLEVIKKEKNKILNNK